MAKAKKTPAPSITIQSLQTEIASLSNQITHHEKAIKNSAAVIQQATGAVMLAQSLLAQLQGVTVNKEPDGLKPKTS